MKRVALIFTALLGLTVFANGTIIEQYHPYPNAARIAVKMCAGGNADVLQCPHFQVRVKRNLEQEKISTTLEIFGRSLLIRSQLISAAWMSAWQADLNFDGKADAIIKFNWGGNGIIWDQNYTTFALSSPVGYKLTTISTITFDPSALIRLNGKATILHTSLVSVLFPANKKFAERYHNYWVFHPLEIRGTKILKNQAAAWVQYTYKPSHRHAQLTPAQKQAGLKDEEPIQFFVPMK